MTETGAMALSKPRGSSVEPSDDKQNHVDLPPAAQKAFSAYEIAEKFMSSPPEKDHEAYEWLEEHPEHCDEYDLPRFETWARHLRTTREAQGKQKHKPRAGRTTGTSVISQRHLAAAPRQWLAEPRRRTGIPSNPRDSSTKS